MKKENNAIVVTSIIAFAVILIAVLAIIVFAPGNTSQNTFTVQGTSTIKVMPDLVSVHFAVRTNGTTSAEANSANKAIYDKLVAALKAQGFNDSQIGTESFSVYPNTYYENGQQKTNGFVADHVVKVEFSANETNLLTNVIDAGINSGAGVNYIGFELSQSAQNKYKAQALELASKDAQVKADAVAQGFGKSTGRLVSVSVQNFNYSPWILYASSGSPSETATARESVANITPTQKDVSATLTAVYKF